MTFEEQNLINRAFDRLSAVSSEPKDADADRLIRQRCDRLPDAQYRLVQSMLLQEQALTQLSDRLEQLESAVSKAGLSGQASQPPQSFLSGYRAPVSASSGSVPAVSQGDGMRARPFDDARADPAPSRAGGFLASALSTAGGVAGGMLLTDGLRELFGSHASSSPTVGSVASAGDLASMDRLQDDAQDARWDAAEARRQLADDDAALDEAQDALDASASDGSWDYGET